LENYAIGYLAGAIYGDGWVNTRLYKLKTYKINFYTADKEYLAVFLTFLHIFLNNYQLCHRKNCYEVTIHSKKLWTLLSSYKYKARYSLPNWIDTIDKKAGFISGLFDTDGSIHGTIPMNLTTKYIENLYPIQLLLKEFGITSYLRRIYIGKKQLARLFIKGYKNKKIFKDIINFHHPKKIEMLEKVLKEKYVYQQRKETLFSNFKQLYAQGKRVTDIKKIMKLPNTTIIAWMDEINPNRKKKKHHNYTKENYFEAIDLAGKGINRYEISKILNIPPSTLFYWLNSNIKPLSMRS
jgi:hypothetical protein